jgi:hypothetical protein
VTHEEFMQAMYGLLSAYSPNFKAAVLILGKEGGEAIATGLIPGVTDPHRVVEITAQAIVGAARGIVQHECVAYGVVTGKGN